MSDPNTQIEMITELLDEFPVQMEWHESAELASYLVMNGVVAQKWVPVAERLPNGDELAETECWDFLCRVLIPERGGTAKEKTMIVHFDILDKQWECDGIIVTHWTMLPQKPKEDRNANT